jgi:hypothetical protein
VNKEVNLGVPYNVGKFLSGRATGGFSRRAQLHGVSWWCMDTRKTLLTIQHEKIYTRNMIFIFHTFCLQHSSTYYKKVKW